MNKRLTKGNDRMLCGVCSGIAEYFNIDPTLVRLGFICLCFCSAGALLGYAAFAICMPNKNI